MFYVWQPAEDEYHLNYIYGLYATLEDACKAALAVKKHYHNLALVECNITRHRPQNSKIALLYGVDGDGNLLTEYDEKNDRWTWGDHGR